MPRKSTSQWEFGDLVEAAESRTVWSVGELTSRIKGRLEAEFHKVWVSGEVSNLRLQSSGHMYFVLKDAQAQLACVLFRGQAGIDRARVVEGVRLLLGGALTVYEPRGQYQLRVTSAEMQGQGALQAAFERLKQKLEAEGLFAAERKRPIPPFPRNVGLVTSPTGAVIRDILHVVGRRFAGLGIVLAASRVQGEGAGAELSRAIEGLNQWSQAERAAGRVGLDVLVVARGGGSIEDLWAFNEEQVARAIAGSAIPVISAVGHETDFTMADFVADLRAATPSAAAEILTAHYVASRETVQGCATRLLRGARRASLSGRESLESLSRRLVRAHPRRRLEARAQRLDELRESLIRLRRRQVGRAMERWHAVQARWVRVRLEQRLKMLRERVQEEVRRMRLAGPAGVLRIRRRFERVSEALRLLSPQQTLDRGYSITLDAATGRILRRSSDVAVGARILTRLGQGRLSSRVDRVEDDDQRA